MAAQSIAPISLVPADRHTPMEISHGEQQGRVVTQLNPKFQKREVVEYQIPVEARITDLYAIAREDLVKIASDLLELTQEIERDNPAAGYEVYFKVIAKGKRPIEVTVLAFGQRTEKEMQMPKMPQKIEDCGFCNNNKPLEDRLRETLTNEARMIWSLEGNPLPISIRHARHILELSAEEIADLITTAAKIVHVHNEHCSRYTLSSHCGVDGHQTFGHPHIHVSGAYTDPSKKPGSQAAAKA